jgi:hypothetical protein
MNIAPSRQGTQRDPSRYTPAELLTPAGRFERRLKCHRNFVGTPRVRPPDAGLELGKAPEVRHGRYT